MAELIITHRQRDYLLKMPYQVIINGRPVGVMRTPQARLRLPAGYYTVTIRTGSFVPLGKKGKTIDMTLSATETIMVSDEIMARSNSMRVSRNVRSTASAGGTNGNNGKRNI